MLEPEKNEIIPSPHPISTIELFLIKVPTMKKQRK